ncbi:MAG: hypothetical protein A2V93_11155 [Ignavibacteria bacterium RBG_16_34_14]|nr:MAG: hypothetical protein A2V93_11155 [Ignavibacteria bacterium RBG_16_34_14]
MTKVVTFVVILTVLTVNSFAQWTQIPSSPSYYIQDIVEADDIIYLAHFSDGVYKSTDSTLSWQLINNGLNTNEAKSVYQILVSGDTLYAATVDGIYKSTNGGDNWVKKSNGITIGPGALNEFTESIYKHNSNLFTGAWNGIYRSTNGAENWIVTNITGQGIEAKNFVNHNGTLFAARESINNPGAYKSIDDGVTWEGITGPFYSTITFLSEPGKLWAGTISGVWLSTDNGTSWEMRNNGLTSDPYSSCIIRINGTLVTSLKFGGSGVFSSTNEGFNWEDFGDGLPFLNTIEKMIVYDDRIIAATSDGLWQRDTIIPVELISFTATYDNGLIMLKWVTAAETNNAGFEIERKPDTENIIADSWEKIGYITGFGTTTEPQDYSFIDDNVSAGKYSYRLKQIDYDGTFQYSSSVEVNVYPKEFVLNQNYPNPFNPKTVISFQLAINGHVSLKVYNVIGQVVMTLIDENLEGGVHNIEFSADGINSGVYFYTLEAKDNSGTKFISAKKMMVLK